MEGKDEDVPLLDGLRRCYTLPTVRYRNIFLTLVAIDGIVSLVLWLCGGDSTYMEDSIFKFQLKTSVFDLAVMAIFKVLLDFLIIAHLEMCTLQKINNPHETMHGSRQTWLHIGSIFLSLAFLAYTATKGGLVLNAVLNDDSYVHMHATYNALTICSVAFSFIEAVMAVYGLKAMRNLKGVRILHLYNDDGVEVDKEGKRLPEKVNIARLFALAKPEAPMLGMAVVCLFVSSGSQMVAPLFFGKVVDSALKSMDELNSTILTLFVVYAGGAVFGMGRSWLFTLAGQKVVARLRKDLFHNIIKQEVAFFDTNRTGELCNRLSSDTQVLQNAVTVNMSMLARYLLQMIGSLILMFTLNPALTGVLLSVVPLISIGAVQYGMYLKKLRQQFQDRLGDAGTQAEENLSSIRTVRTFSGERKATDIYGADVEKSYMVGKKLAAAGGIFEGGVGVLVYGSITLVLWYGGKLVNEGEVTPGVLTSFLLYTLQVAMAFALMSALYGDFMQAVGASVRIFDLMDRKPLVSNEKGITLPDLTGYIEFKSVDFTYPSRPETKVLKKLSFTVNPGEVVALVGPSGGGKSTVVNLIERFYDPDAGTITLGGSDLRDLDPEWFRQKISMVSQEPTLFACSIKDNIAYGRQATLDEVKAVATEANADEFIQGFEEGYETLVGERGVRLSGGQKQRIAIARALIMNPVILLLDEATSALDAENWLNWLPADTEATIKRGGFYSTTVFKGLKLISLNMNMCNSGNWWLFINDTDPAGMLQWMISELQEAENNGDKVYIIGHIMPGCGCCLKPFSWNFYKIVNRYESTIAEMFFGHSHADYWEMFYDQLTMVRPLGVAYIPGSITTYSDMNPGYRIYEIDGNYNGTSWKVQDYTNYFLNLTKANQMGVAFWEKEYSAKEEYGLPSLFPKDWNNLIYQMKTDDNLYNKFCLHFSKSNAASKCEDRKGFLCQLKTGRNGDPHICDDL